MLVKLTSNAGPSVSMFESDAKWMLRNMNQSGTIPSAIRAEDVRTALNHLQDAVNKKYAEDESVEIDTADSDENVAVSINTRAYPLVQLLQAADEKQGYIMWDYE